MLPIEYIWLDGNNMFRSKTRVLMNTPKEVSIKDIPEWNYDGSSTHQASGDKSEVVIKPRRMFKSPFQNTSVLVLCDTYLPNGDPHPTNSRHKANTIFNKKRQANPWFGLEQEYFIINPKTDLPIGFSTDIPKKHSDYYCGIGTNKAFGRSIANEHFMCCLTAGIIVSGMNAEVAPSQWEFQVGPCEGIEAGDHLWVARYILERVAEKYNVKISYHPKAVKENWNGSGCHLNYSTLEMREGTPTKTGLDFIHEAIKILEDNHDELMEVYGEDNEERMTGENETSDFEKFSWGVGSRDTSVRIPNETNQKKKGYFEDRRPGANVEPYVATSMLFEITAMSE
jgi:glutamine synthetase